MSKPKTVQVHWSDVRIMMREFVQAKNPEVERPWGGMTMEMAEGGSVILKFSEDETEDDDK